MGPEDIFKNVNKGQSKIIMPGEEQQQMPDPIEMIAMELQRLGMGVAQTSRTNALIGKATDLSQLSVQLLFNVLVEKEVISEEDLKKMYQEQVIDRYKQMEQQAKEHAEQQMKEHQEQQMQGLKDASKEDDKATEAVVSDAEEVIDNVRHIVREND